MTARAILTLLLVTLALTVTACGRGTDTQEAAIAGRVVTTAKEASGATLTRPIAGARVLVADMASGEPVVEVHSDADGRFVIPIPPGRYTVRAVTKNGVKAWSPVIATVRAGNVTSVTLEIRTR